MTGSAESPGGGNDPETGAQDVIPASEGVELASGDQSAQVDGPEEVRRVEDTPSEEAGPEFWGQNQRSKAMEKIEDLAGKLEEACRTNPMEIEASRNFSHDLGGRLKGWRVITDVRVMVRKI